jgi:hypothetical protein
MHDVVQQHLRDWTTWPSSTGRAQPATQQSISPTCLLLQMHATVTLADQLTGQSLGSMYCNHDVHSVLIAALTVNITAAALGTGVILTPPSPRPLQTIRQLSGQFDKAPQQPRKFTAC